MTTETSLDAQIAKQLFGWTLECNGLLSLASSTGGGQWFCPECGRLAWPGQTHSRLLRPYSTDRALVWDVIDAMRAQGWAEFMLLRAMRLVGRSVGENVWEASFGNVFGTQRAFGDTAPEAVCRAALEALRQETDDAPGSRRKEERMTDHLCQFCKTPMTFIADDGGVAVFWCGLCGSLCQRFPPASKIPESWQRPAQRMLVGAPRVSPRGQTVPYLDEDDD